MNRKIEQNIIHFISKQKLLEKGDKLLIALSGGPDSVFALQFFHKFKSKFKIDIEAMHVNHLLRGDESEMDENFCKSLCNELKVNFSSAKVNVTAFAKNNKLSIEEAARNLRYQKLTDYASKIEATKIVTAHNMEDNTETVLLNLFRGTGLKGVSGIPIIRDNIIRPLLSVSKVDILNYLNFNNIQYRVDSTNFENDFTRNYLRNEIIPKIKENINSKIDNNILKFSQIVSQSERAIYDYTLENINKFITKKETGIEISNLIDNEKFDNVFPNVVKFSVEKEFDNVCTFDDVHKIKSLFSLQPGSMVELSSNIIALREREFVFVHSQNKTIISEKFELQLDKEIHIENKIISAEIVERIDVNYSSSGNVEFISGDVVSFPLTIRTWENGDKFNPIGLKGTKKISDFLTESKVESSSRSEQLVLLSEDKIIWVVGYRIDESVKINNGTNKIIKLQARCI